MSDTMTLPYDAEVPQFFAKMMNAKREKFIKLCQKWDSARELADDLSTIGYEQASERTCTNWRNRAFKKVPYNAVQAVKLAAEMRKQKQSREWSKSLEEAASL